MKITFFDINNEEKEVFSRSFSGVDVSFIEEKLNEDNSKNYVDAEIISVFVSSSVNKNVIDAMPNLKFIATRSTGFDHIDIAYCKEKGIQVSSVPSYGSHTVAEFAFALLLTLSRKIFTAVRRLKEEGGFSFKDLEGFDLYGKTIGVVGTGKIGKNLIKIAKGFGMNVIAYDLYPDMEFAKEVGFEYETLAEVISGSDVISLHTPYTKENHHLLNKENIATMKKGVYIINTARGELIDTDAIVWGLKEGIIGALGVDVMEGEKELKNEMEILSSVEKAEKVKDYKTLLEDKVLIEMPNVIVTPHAAFYSKEAEGEIIKTSADNISSFIAGNPQNLLK